MKDYIWRNTLRIPHRWRVRWHKFFMRIAWWGFNVGIKVRDIEMKKSDDDSS